MHVSHFATVVPNGSVRKRPYEIGHRSRVRGTSPPAVETQQGQLLALSSQLEPGNRSVDVSALKEMSRIGAIEGKMPSLQQNPLGARGER